MSAKKENNDKKNISKAKIYAKFGPDVQQLIIYAKAASLNAKIDCIYPESVMVGILSLGENIVNTTLSENDIDLEGCLKVFKTQLNDFVKLNVQEGVIGSPSVSSWFDLKISKSIITMFQEAYNISEEFHTEFITIGHIFYSLLKISPDFRSVINKHVDANSNITMDKLENIFQEIRDNKKLVKSTSSTSPKKSSQRSSSILAQFAVNMTELASLNKYDPIIARENEIEEAITILCRRNKSNPLLVGEAGVGKSAIVEGIAQRIVSNAVPKKIQGCKVFALNLTSMVAGTKYRGEFEERMVTLLKEIENDDKIIVFIDEIHVIMGTGSSSGGAMDAANILKPALARSMKCIGATTNAEYKKHIAEDAALMRRFGTVNVDEPNEESTKMILLGIKSRLENFHECLITDDAIDSAIYLTKRYRTDKHFPDKAIDCIDTACAKYGWSKKEGVPSISSADIAMVVSKQCDIPIEIIMWDSYDRIKKTEEILSTKVIGQENAIKSICRILKNAYSGIRNPNRPIGSVVFGGQSGTGKTYTAKQLAATMFGSESAFIRMDMTEYTEEHSISKIIGAPPGYVGFNDDVVADRIRRKPYCVILVDEVEKAHPKVMKIFLQIMGDGILTTSTGEKIDCKNTIIVMTGNFGMNTEAKQSLGFGASSQSSFNQEKEKGRLISFCERMFGLEFVNRVDDFIPFNPLTDDNLRNVIKLRLSEFSSRIQNKNISVNFEDSLCNYLIDISKKEHGMNAMIIERMISKNLEPCIADELLMYNKSNKGSKKHIITVFVENNEVKSKVNE